MREERVFAKKPREELLVSVLKNLTHIGIYVADLMSKIRGTASFSVEEVYQCISYLVGRGLVIGRGDGFGVLYSLTPQGLDEQSRLS